MEEDIFFSERITSDSSKLLLFELPAELMLELDSHALHLSGSSQNEAIVCGRESSYLIRKTETSNSLLLVEKNQIVKVEHDVFVCEKIIPPLHQVFLLLNESPYTSGDQSK